MAAGFRCLRAGIFHHLSPLKANRRSVNSIFSKTHGSFILMSSNSRLYSLVVGLGNYSMPNTRHSVGMAVVNHLAEKLGVHWHYNKKFHGYLAVTQIEHLDVILLKPKLLMNVNGRSVVQVVSAYNIQPSHVILVHDNLDKPLGKCSIKYGGSAGGHNGVKSSIGCMMSTEMARLRVGIGRPSDRSQVTEYVLQNFDASEKPILKYVLEDCSDMILTHLHPSSGTNNDNAATTSSCSRTRKMSRGKAS